MQSQPIIIKESVSNFSSNYHGEVKALHIASNHLKNLCNTRKPKGVHIFSDCKAAIVATNSTKTHSTLQVLLDETQKNIYHLQNVSNTTVNIYWVPGHADLEPNETADKAAKEAAHEASLQKNKVQPSLNVIKNIIRKHIYTKWQKAWNRYAYTECYNLLPVVPKYRYTSNVTKSRVLESKFFRLLSGHSRLNDHIHKLFPIESPCCECGNERQTVKHIMLECTINQEARRVLVDAIDQIYHKHQTPVWERSLNLDTMLSPMHTNIQTRQEIRKLVITFIASISFNI